MKTLKVHRDAESELDAAMQWYEEQRTGLGLAFHDAVQDVFNRIEQTPSSGWKYLDQGYRVLPTARFPYLVYYIETDEVIWISAITHERRRPDYWKDRIQS